MVKVRQSHRRSAGGEARCGGGLRIWSFVDEIDSEDALHAARHAPHPMVLVAGRGEAGKDAGDDLGGCRSSGELGAVAVTALVARAGHLRALRNAGRKLGTTVGPLERERRG